VGNVFIAKSQFIDIADFEDPDRKEVHRGSRCRRVDAINDIIRQVPITDMTAGSRRDEAVHLIRRGDVGANQGLQGQTSRATSPQPNFSPFSRTLVGVWGRLHDSYLPSNSPPDPTICFEFQRTTTERWSAGSRGRRCST